MTYKKCSLILLLAITGLSLALGHEDDQLFFVGQDEPLQNPNSDQIFDHDAVLFQTSDLKYPGKIKELIHATDGSFEDEENDAEEQPAKANQAFAARRRRVARQAPISSILESITQECDGITLRWLRPNIPYSLIYHNDNLEFSHYNVYRETSQFISVDGLRPIASGNTIQELRDIRTDKWTDKFPPSGTGLFYAVTVVDHRGVEIKNVVSKQVTFFGSIEKAANNLNPVRIVPAILQGNVLHHSVAYNPVRNEYMVVFDNDVNSDGKPDHVYGVRVNDLGQIIDRRILNVTVGMATTEQGYSSVAFNRVTQKYLVAFQLTAPSLFQGKSIIIGQHVHAHVTDRNGRPFVLLKATTDGTNHVSTRKPNLIYNSGTGGFAMTVLIDNSPTTALAAFFKADGKQTSVQPMFNGEVLEAILFMDTKQQHVYFVFQVSQWSANFINAKQGQSFSYSYVITTAKANATGAWLTLTGPATHSHLVGFTNKRRANIAGYFNEKDGWLAVFWNNRVNGKEIISSSIVFAKPGFFFKETDVNSCPTQNNVANPASCYLPTNNAHILLWEQGSQIGGHLVRDDTFRPTSGEQREPKVVLNTRNQHAFVVWKQRTTPGGSFVLYVRTIVPGSRFTCTPSCQQTMKCAMKNTCAPRNPGQLVSPPTCSVSNGGCSHTCQTETSGRRCQCPLSYTLALDGKRCYLTAGKPDVSLLYSSKGSVWSVSVYYQSKRTTYTKIPIQGREIISFFYNNDDKYLYWADGGEEKIYRALLDGSNKQVLVSNQILIPDGMVADPDAKQLYWTDGALGVIFRTSLDGSNKVFFVSSLDKPRALAFHRQNKWLYWTTWGSTPTIERINTDGSNRQVLINTGLVWPNGLALSGSNLYWVDAKLRGIFMSDLNGQGKVAITKTNVIHPFSVDLAGSKIFWSDWAGDIRMLDKSSPGNVESVVVGITKPYHLQIYDGTAMANARYCLDPGVPNNGGRRPAPDVRGKYQVNDRVVLTCNPGFRHLGSNNRQCLQTGIWSGTTTRCIALPVFTITPTNTSVDVGNSVVLQCSAENSDGAPSTITWYKDGNVIVPHPRGRYGKIRSSGFFHFLVTVATDNGVYTCVASNEAGQVRASMFLNIRSQHVADCGIATLKQRAKIIGGKRAAAGSIPWQVLLMLRNKGNSKTRPFCGGVLLNRRWMVTAAHCLVGLSLWEIEVRLGEHNWKVNEKNEQVLSVGSIYMHSQYNVQTFDSDIALIKFKHDAILNDYVKPICLPLKAAQRGLLKVGSSGTISGWGARNSTKSKKPVKTLHRINVPIATEASCKKAFPTYLFTSNMFCAGDPTMVADACQGDSGGPFTIVDPGTGRSVLIGIVSWGETNQCGVKDKYGVYTKVQNYVNWISNRIKL